MNISISTANLYHIPFETALRIYKKAGYEFIELAGYWKGGEWEIAQHLKDINPKDAIQMVKDSRLKISTFHDMGGIIEEGAESVVSDLTYEYMKYYDFPCIVFHAPHRKNADKEWWENYKPVIAGDLKALDPKILLCVENLSGFHADYFMPLIQPEEMLEFLDANGFYANIDTTHYAQAGIDIAHAASILKNKVKTIHISDHADNKKHLFIGDGNLDFIAFFSNINARELHSVTVECDISADNEEAIVAKAQKAKLLVENLIQ
ncbi:MAG: sugar phosphate isomerase/epimerase [Oscillospiraceae bacterium]|nr:sugar phosphate isomerase/epimerase [Oscillospiraceae bacterium]